MNLAIKNTPPTRTYSLDSPSTDKDNGIMFLLGEGDIGRILVPRSDLEKVARFQRRVWEALSTVRIGAVITYAALARRVGQPDAIPAVANACANSPLGFAISCHRVVRSNNASHESAIPAERRVLF
jgi:O-6-methylguanine DNA methyltransferase